jgi:hypothetical protein
MPLYTLVASHPIAKRSNANEAGLVTGQLWSISTTNIQVRLRIQLNTILFAKTLVRKDVASSAPTSNQSITRDGQLDNGATGEAKDGEDDFSSKAQVMTLMTTDVDRVSDLAWHLFALVGALNACVVMFVSP